MTLLLNDIVTYIKIELVENPTIPSPLRGEGKGEGDVRPVDPRCAGSLRSRACRGRSNLMHEQISFVNGK